MYAFIHIPKTGGSSLRHLLRCVYGASHCDIKAPKRSREPHDWIGCQDLKRTKRIYPRLAGICGHRVVPFMGLETCAPAIRYFTFLREPCQRMTSHFLHFNRDRIDQVTPEDLKTYCQEPANGNVQTRWLSGGTDAQAAIDMIEEKISFVGLTETFDESLAQFAAWLADPRLKPHYRARNHCHGRPAWPILQDPDLAGVIEEANQADLEVYRHVCESVIPRQNERFGSSALPVKSDVVHKEHWVSQFKRNMIYKPVLHLVNA